MSQHLSFFNTDSLPQPLNPQRVMQPYVLCWCGSGKKWKFCHKDREKQQPINIFEHSLEIRRKFNSGYCSHPNANPSTCSKKIIRSHTIQRNGGLGDIADNANHVISFKAGYENIAKNSGTIKPIKVGYKIASTFMGFCETHDCQMFKPIETGGLTLNSETAFLFAFRAISYELYSKEIALSLQPIHREIDRGAPFEKQAFIQEYFHYYFSGTHNGLNDLLEFKKKYDNAYINSSYDDFCFYGVEFAEKLPIVSCGAFYPEFDFKGHPIQLPISGPYELQHITFNLTVVNGTSIAIFGWTQDAPGPTIDFIKSIDAIKDDLKANAIILLAFEHLENTYANPAWWESLSSDTQEYLIQKTQSGLGAFAPERTGKSFDYNSHILTQVKVKSTCHSPNITL